MNRYILMLRLFLIRNTKKKAEYLKKRNIFHKMGDNCGYHPFKIPSEPYLLSIHNNVSIAANVDFVTHDITCDVFNGSKKFKNFGKHKYYMGTIEIFDNVFVGANSIIMYNTKIGPNAIVAAGSIVTKDVPEGVIVGGNPAKIIGNIYDLEQKRYNQTLNMPSNHDNLEKINSYFWNESN